jgi:hypothetical protein
VVDTNKLTLQWLAGFFDGEGSVSLRRHGNNWALRVNLTQANYPLLAAIAAKYGASYGPYTKNRRTKSGKESIVYEIGWANREALKKILQLLDGVVVAKERQVKLALEFLETGVGSGYRFNEDANTKRESIRNEMRWLNHAGPDKPASETVFTSPEYADVIQ